MWLIYPVTSLEKTDFLLPEGSVQTASWFKVKNAVHLLLHPNSAAKYGLMLCWSYVGCHPMEILNGEVLQLELLELIEGTRGL